MSNKQFLVRFLAAVLAAFASCFFVRFYSVACSLSYRPNYPALTEWVLRNAKNAYAIPVIVLGVGVWVLMTKKAAGVALEILVAVIWIGAFAWVLAAIYAWQLAQIEIWSGAGRNLH